VQFFNIFNHTTLYKIVLLNVDSCYVILFMIHLPCYRKWDIWWRSCMQSLNFGQREVLDISNDERLLRMQKVI
jgi:hypothetical protein